MRRMVLALVAALVGMVVALAVPVAHAQQAGEFVTRARNAILIDYDSGSVLFQKAPDEPVPPASMSKLMTLAVLFRALKEGKVTLETELQTSENAWRSGGAPSGTAAMFIPIKNMTPISELIQGIAVQSGNDAALTVAEGLAGSVEKFVQMMQEEARKIGLKHSTFRNPTGLHHDEHLMSARDLAVLARHIIREYPEHYKVFSQKEFLYRKHKFFNRNPLLGTSGIDGMKTGHTAQAGYGLVVSASVDGGRRLLGVVMGLPEAKERRDDAKRLIDWGTRSISKVTLFPAGEPVGYARVWGGKDLYVSLVGDGDVEVVLPKFPANQKLRGEVVYEGPLKPPVKKGDKVAVFRVTSTVAGTTEPLATSETPLYAAEDVEASSFAWKGIDALLHLALRMVNL